VGATVAGGAVASDSVLGAAVVTVDFIEAAAVVGYIVVGWSLERLLLTISIVIVRSAATLVFW